MSSNIEIVYMGYLRKGPREQGRDKMKMVNINVLFQHFGREKVLGWSCL